MLTSHPSNLEKKNYLQKYVFLKLQLPVMKHNILLHWVVCMATY